MSLISDERVEELLANEKEKDAEIERLKEAFDIIADKLVIAETKIRIDHDNALEADELLAAKDAEIERLRGYWARAVALHEQYDAEIQRLKALCARAAEVLEILGYKGPVATELRKAAE